MQDVLMAQNVVELEHDEDMQCLDWGFKAQPTIEPQMHYSDDRQDPTVLENDVHAAVWELRYMNIKNGSKAMNKLRLSIRK